MTNMKEHSREIRQDALKRGALSDTIVEDKDQDGGLDWPMWLQPKSSPESGLQTKQLQQGTHLDWIVKG